MSNFTSIHTQATWIAGAYKLIGLYSIPLLTLVTIVSMVNVFTAGTFAHWPGVATIWAFVFALAIDVNIVRLFVEAKREKRRGAFCIGLGLCIVTGAALFLEGLQQSISLSWDNQIIQYSVSILVAFRVILVIVLMAYEGTRLGALLQSIEDEKASQVAPNSDTNSPENSGQVDPELPTEQEAIPDPVLPIVEAIAPPEPALHAVVEPQFRQPMNPQARYSAKEAAKWDVCKNNGVKSSDITGAIASGELKANLQGMFSKTALESWVKQRAKLAA